MSSNTDFFPVKHSIQSTPALMSHIPTLYDIAEPIECKFLNLGLNDTYLIRTNKERYILRIYRANWRSLSDILYELDMLTHLDRKHVSVSIPLPMKDGNYIHSLKALEGTRYVVLFTYAERDEFFPQNEVHSLLYGHTVAEIHNALDDFSSEHERFHLDLDHLINKPLQAILPLLTNRLEDSDYLLSIADKLKDQLTNLPITALEWGVCHGDFHGGNAHLTEDQKLTFFDFDCCGPGWRAYDIAVYPWSISLAKQDSKLWEAFLEGYTQQRDVGELDLAAVPLFVAIRHIWLLGLHTGNGDDWGYGWLTNRYFGRQMKFLREWVAEQIDWT